MKKFASGAVLGLTLLLFILWWAFLRAPGPVDVCDHIMAVTLREASEQSLSDQTQTQLVESMHMSCIEHKQNKILLRGRVKYAEYAKCVVSSETLADIGRC